MEEKFSMAMKYKFNTFVLPYPELQVTEAWETITGEGIPTSLPFSYTLPLSSGVGCARKGPRLLSISGLSQYSCSSTC